MSSEITKLDIMLLANTAQVKSFGKVDSNKQAIAMHRWWIGPLNRNILKHIDIAKQE